MSSSEMHVRGALTVDYSSVAATVFLLWDIIITIGDEVGYIWPKPRTYWAKWLFLFVRYFALVLQISLLFVGTRVAADLGYTHRACVIWYIYQEVAVSMLIITVEFILVIRVKALYHQNNIVAGIVYLLYLVEVVAMVVSLARAVPKVGFDSACVVTSSPIELLHFAIAYIGFEVLLFLLTVYKLVETLYNGWGTTPVLNVIVRDGTWAFVLIFVTLVFNAVFYLTAAKGSSTAAVAYSWIISVESFAGYRILLNMQKLDPHDISTLDSPTLSTDIQFTTNIELDHTTGSIDEAEPYSFPSTNESDEARQSFLNLGKGGIWGANTKSRGARRGSGGRSRLDILRGRLSFSPTTASNTNEEFEMSVTSRSGSTSGHGSSSRGERDWSKPSTSYA
ncbi:unnamed protein product [Peniophora sp. CBMAI 1063]|nr:unnamed protein product [Peniophora sp. CBMAI 1063]